MGLDHRVRALGRAAKSTERKIAIEKAAERLVDVMGMGWQYRVLALTGSGYSPNGMATNAEVYPFTHANTAKPKTVPGSRFKK